MSSMITNPVVGGKELNGTEQNNQALEFSWQMSPTLTQGPCLLLDAITFIHFLHIQHHGIY